MARWLKAPGDPIAALEPLLEINTDKIDTEVPAPAAGTLLEIVVGEGKTVRAGTVLAYIGTVGERPVASTPPAAADTRIQPALQAATVSSPPAEAKPQGRAFISPVVARLAAEHALDLEQIAGTGLGGRITKQDVLAYLAQRPLEIAEAPRQTMPQPPAALGADEVWQPLTAMRRLIAQHMVQSKRISPHVTTVFE
ncbi:MAG: 2-oxo acid dehydrogenase subunit E2, partial [Chloroflexi bacterium]